MDDILILPGNEQELFDHYFDATKYADLKERHSLLQRAINNTLPIQERRRHKLTGEVADLLKEYHQLTHKLFQAAMFSFATRVCEEQKEICEQQFWIAPCGEEAEYITDGRMPDLCDDPVLYARIKDWWLALDLEQMKEISAIFEDDFGPVYSEGSDDDETESLIGRRWQCLPLESRKRIYNHYNPKS